MGFFMSGLLSKKDAGCMVEVGLVELVKGTKK